MQSILLGYGYIIYFLCMMENNDTHWGVGGGGGEWFRRPERQSPEAGEVGCEMNTL
jgi:hypothetical protein